MPPQIIVCGPPASGKTLLAEQLSLTLSLPVISKDLIKDALMDHLGGLPETGSAEFCNSCAIARSARVSSAWIQPFLTHPFAAPHRLKTTRKEHDENDVGDGEECQHGDRIPNAISAYAITAN